MYLLSPLINLIASLLNESVKNLTAPKFINSSVTRYVLSYFEIQGAFQQSESPQMHSTLHGMPNTWLLCRNALLRGQHAPHRCNWWGSHVGLSCTGDFTLVARQLCSQLLLSNTKHKTHKLVRHKYWLFCFLFVFCGMQKIL